MTSHKFKWGKCGCGKKTIFLRRENGESIYQCTKCFKEFHKEELI